MKKEIVGLILIKDLKHEESLCPYCILKISATNKKLRRKENWADLFRKVFEETQPYERKIAIGDKTWIFQHDPETEHLILQWNSPGTSKAIKACISKLKVNAMMIHFSIAKELYIMNLFLHKR